MVDEKVDGLARKALMALADIVDDPTASSTAREKARRDFEALMKLNEMIQLDNLDPDTRREIEDALRRLDRLDYPRKSVR